MHISLAPMEGVVDHLMRDMLTRIGGYDLCVTEFVRVVDQLLPPKVFYRLCPELKQQGRTSAGTPVKVQLLGQDPGCLAENAVRAIELGSHGIDLNFGCPAKTVNKSKGGAVLLRETRSLYAIVSAVRRAVDSQHMVTAKMRLGFEDKALAIDNALALEAAGADLITVHARTKAEGYRPPAYWDWIARIREQVGIPVVANGEIWSAADAQACRQQSDCDDIMLGRGALALPNLAQVIRGAAPMSWDEVKHLLVNYSGYEIYGDKGRYYPNRIKQWLGYLKRQYSEAHQLFEQIRTLKTAEQILPCLQR
jgi:tRNA-dihydrouridine synthase C